MVYRAVVGRLRRLGPGSLAMGAFALFVGCGVAGVEHESVGQEANEQQAAEHARVVPAAATAAPASRADGRVARYVVLDGPGAIDSLGGSDVDEPAAQKQLAKRLQALRADHAALRPQLEALGAEIIADVVLVANAIQIRIDRDQLAAVQRLAGVQELQTPTVLQRSLDAAVPLVGGPSMWETAPGLHGEGMSIGIIDTGIDYLHADLGGAGDPDEYTNNDPTVIEASSFPTLKVIGGTDLAGNDYDASGLDGSLTPTPDDDPLDCNGHGSHVAGIAAGTGVLDDGSPYAGPWDASLDPTAFAVYPGMAPAASLFAIKIFGCAGSTDLLLPAFELAADPDGDGNVSDRLDVVNLSVGSGFALGSEVEAAALGSLTDAGSVVVVAAGNSGGEGRAHFGVGFPASVPQALAVAASLKIPEAFSFLALEVTAPAQVAGSYPVGTTGEPPNIGSVGSIGGQLVTTTPDIACDPVTNPTDLDGNIAIVRRGACTFNVKADNVAAAGAVAMLIVDNAYADHPMSPFNGNGGHAVPMWIIRRTDGDALWDAAPLTASLTDGVTQDVVVGPDYVARFSSRGPTADALLLKPDLSAPGYDIVSTLVGSGWEGAGMSGTSMACPMTAGAVALLRQGRPALEPAAIKQLLTSSAVPTVNGVDQTFPTSLAGAGRIQIDAALAADVTANVDGVVGEIGASFGVVLATAPHTETRTVVVTNLGGASVDLDVALEPALEWPGATVAVTPTSISVAAGSTATVELSLTVDPAALPAAPAYEPFTKPISTVDFDGVGHDAPNIFITEASGMVVFEHSGSNDRAAAVAYHGVVRAAAERTVDSVVGCLAGAGSGTAGLILGGTPAAHDNATSVLELGTESSSFDDPTGPDASRDIVAVGALSDPASNRMFFGVVTAADWVTPARGWFSEVGIEVDVDDDASADFLLVAESFSAFDPARPDMTTTLAPFTRVVELATGALNDTLRPLNGAFPAYPGGVFFAGDPPDTHETHIYLNRVLVFPVELDALGLDASSNGALSYRGVSAVSRLPLVLGLPMEEPLDTTDWVSFDAAAPRLALPDCLAGTSLCPDDDGTINLALPSDGANLPTLLVLHHGNGVAPKHDIVDLASATVEAGDLSVAADSAVGAEITLDEEGSATFTVTNASGTGREGVVVTVAVTGGSVATLSASSGSCSASACDLGSLAAGASATVTVAAQPAAAGTMTVSASVSSQHDCETDASNDEASSGFTVTEAPVTTPPSSTPSSTTEDDSGCGCRLPAKRTDPGWPAALALLLLAALRWRSLRTARRR